MRVYSYISGTRTPDNRQNKWRHKRSCLFSGTRHSPKFFINRLLTPHYLHFLWFELNHQWWRISSLYFDVLLVLRGGHRRYNTVVFFWDYILYGFMTRDRFLFFVCLSRCRFPYCNYLSNMLTNLVYDTLIFNIYQS